MAGRRKKAEEPLLMALACGASVESVARSTGISERTIHRRLRDPEFARRLQSIRTDMVHRTSAMLTAASLESVKTLIELQQNSNPAAVRLGAARAVLELALRVREATELTERVAALEEQLHDNQPLPVLSARAA